MFVQVAIERVPSQLFTYAVPEGLEVQVGQHVTAPWRKVYPQGYVIALTETTPYVPKAHPSAPTVKQEDLFGAEAPRQAQGSGAG